MAIFPRPKNSPLSSRPSEREPGPIITRSEIRSTVLHKTVASTERLAAIRAHTKATLWIHHDKALSDTQNKSPADYD